MKKLLLMATALLFACTADLFAQTIHMEGAGTKESPYLIKKESDFKEVFTAEYYNTTGNYLYYRQEADLNFTGVNAINANGSTKPWVIEWFAGNYDGNGHSITYSITVDLATCGHANIGLFGLLTKSAVVKNLKIYNSEIVLKYENSEGSVGNGKYIGMIAGVMGRKVLGRDANGNVVYLADDGTNYNMRIANCRIENSTIDASHLNGHLSAYELYFGGVVGLMQAGTLHEVAFTDDTPRGEGYTLQGFSIVGGIVGRMMPTWGGITMDKTPRTIENCLFRGSILSKIANISNQSNQWSGAGGIVGRVEGNNLANDKITNCYVDASKIMTHSGYIGGLSAGVAVLNASFNVYHCFADVGSFEERGTFCPITAKINNSIDAKSQYSGACVTTGEGIKYYHTGALGSVPMLSNNSNTINSMTNSEKISTYLGDAFIQICEQQEQVCKIQLKSTIKGYIYSAKDGDFLDPKTWQNYPDSWGENIAVTPTDAQWSNVLGIEIKHKVTLNNNEFSHTFGAIPIKIIDNNERAALIVKKEGVFANATIKVEEGGSFVNTTSSNVKGVIEKRLHGGIWNFIGLSGYENLAPLRNRLLRENQSENTGNTGNEILKFWALGYDYEQSKWDEDNYLYWEDNIAPGAGILVYTNGDNILVEIGQNRDDQGNETMKNFENLEQVSHTFQSCGPWVALANPYPAVMDARRLMNEIGTQNIQGQGIYVREAKSYDWTFVTHEENNKQINAAQGFFVKFSGETTQNRTITLSKTMLANYPQQNAKSQSKSVSGAGEFLRVSVASEGYRVPVMYRQNDAASAEYDIFDADKLFGSGTVAEPYFALGERMLCKQEADSTHFVADLNIRSEQSRSVEIIAEYIPEGYTLSLIDANNETVMNQDDVYTADIARGDNEGRFKLVINKNNVSIEDVANVEEINFYNNNRQITISGGNIKLVQVYNTLGQKVYETKQRTFTLDEVASGTYIVNVQTDETSFSNKIVVH